MPAACDHDPVYSRSECGWCGSQDAHCRQCGVALCGCNPELHPSEPSGSDLEAPGGTRVDSGSTGGLEGAQIFDPVHSPEHYRKFPIEVIEITERLNFCLGNVVKYTLRADYKGKPLEDLRKARWYLDREIANRERGEPP